MKFALVVGTTETALIPGISAAGAHPEAIPETPAADAELITYGCPVYADGVPVSPTGCPTPALVTRAVSELIELEPLVIDAGLTRQVAAPTVAVGDRPGGDVRTAHPVPNAADVVTASREFGRAYPAAELVVGESIPGGTTTALGVLNALGVDASVSSSLPDNPLALKRDVVEAGLRESGLERGDLRGQPVEAIRRMGDPVLAAVFGLVRGAIQSETAITLAGGSQMLAVCGLLRQAGISAPFTVATTCFVADDDTAGIRETADALDVDVVVTDPGFDRTSHDAVRRYLDGEAKEGAGMGGALAMADREGISMATVRDRIVQRYEALVAGIPDSGTPA